MYAMKRFAPSPCEASGARREGEAGGGGADSDAVKDSSRGCDIKKLLHIVEKLCTRSG